MPLFNALKFIPQLFGEFLRKPGAVLVPAEQTGYIKVLAKNPQTDEQISKVRYIHTMIIQLLKGKGILTHATARMSLDDITLGDNKPDKRPM